MMNVSSVEIVMFVRSFYYDSVINVNVDIDVFNDFFIIIYDFWVEG